MMRSPELGYRVPVVLALLLHALLLVVLLFPWPSWSKQKKIVSPNYLKARLVQIEPAKPAPVVTPPEKTKSRPIVKKSQPSVKKKPETSTRNNNQKTVAVKKKPAPKQIEKARDTDKKTNQNKTPSVTANQAKKPDLQTLQESELMAALASEQATLTSQKQAQEDEQQARSYFQQIKTAIEQYWSRPLSARNGMEVLLKINLVPTGEVSQVSIVRGSGDPAFDRSAVVAVKAAAPFEVPEQARQFETYFREISMRFKPEDLPD